MYNNVFTFSTVEEDQASFEQLQSYYTVIAQSFYDK